MKKLIIYSQGKKSGTIEQIRGRLRTSGNGAQILKGVKTGAIRLGGEMIPQDQIFDQLPKALDGAYLAAELQEA